MKILTLFNIKGGIGKTTLTTLVAYKLANEGNKVLVIDADLQSNMTQFMYKIIHEDKTLYDAIIYGTSASELIIKTPNKLYPTLDIIPSDIQLSFLTEEMAVRTNKNELVARWMKNNIETLKQYDYIMFDLSPSIELLNRNILFTIDSVVIPLSHGDLASIRGAELFNKLYKIKVKEIGIEDVSKKAVLLNNNKGYNRKILELFDAQLQQYKFVSSHLLKTTISESTTIQQAPILKRAISDLTSKYKNKKIEKQIDALVEELKQKEIL